MTLEEVFVQETAVRAQSTGKILEEVLVSAKNNDCLTIGVYESAKVMNGDPDSVAFCVLATDDEYECDIALQIHFTLIQAFCFDNDISIVKVNDMEKLVEILGDKAGDLEDAHCVLITNPNEDSWKDPALEKLHLFCEESRSLNDWARMVEISSSLDVPEGSQFQEAHGPTKEGPRGRAVRCLPGNPLSFVRMGLGLRLRRGVASVSLVFEGERRVGTVL
ncbi:hypothetical protein GJAV_G00026170 [Gymnothorax javanicus]|nr:hypothetical protein GJAV_G00026170 [Gymnothorax javanicus]